MSIKTIFSLTLATALMWLLSGCLFQDKCEEDVTYVHMQPVYVSMAELRSQVGSEPARAMEKPGKLFSFAQYVFINEIGEGVHVIDNRDPRNPQSVSFIRVPGVHDMAVKGNTLYVDSYTDMVSIDISDPVNAREIGRQEDAFVYGSWHPNLWANEDSGIAVRFESVEVQETVPCGNYYNEFGGAWQTNTFAQTQRDDVVVVASSAPTGTASAVPGGEIPNGVGGSMSRFTLVNDYLYVVTSTDLQAYSVANIGSPVFRSTQSIGWGNIETVFPMKDHLFIGSMNGMFVYSLSSPERPEYVSEMQHITSCDPVVAEGDYAYVTLRGGNECGSVANQLDVVNISDISNPWLVTSYPMQNPHGLGISQGTLFICDGDAGLKVYDARDVNAIDRNQLAHFPNINAFDVIPLAEVLLMVGEDGFYQYDYTDVNNIQLMSTILVQR
jgi:hypothetical protein